MDAATRRPPPSSVPACPAACSRSRRTTAGDSMATSSITPMLTPSRSAADAASMASSTASATPGGDGSLLLVLPDQMILGRQRPQLRQVRRVTHVLLGDHRRGLIQRQRQIPQLDGHGQGAVLVGQAGPPVQQGQRLLGAERVDRDTCPELRRRLPGHGDQYPGLPGRRDERPQQTRILHVIEHQQATAPVGLQPVPDRLARVGRARPGTADRQPRGVGHRGQPRQQGLAVPGVDPRDEPPACPPASPARTPPPAGSCPLPRYP